MKFNYKKICSTLLKNLPPRTSEVIERRFGLKTGRQDTLESIGKSYEITRERVRQIEQEGLLRLKHTALNQKRLFSYFNDVLGKFGGIKKEDIFLASLGKDSERNNIFFLLKLNKDSEYFPETNEFYSFWQKSKKNILPDAKKAVSSAIETLEREKAVLSLQDLYQKEKEKISKTLNRKIKSWHYGSFIELSKIIRQNPEGELGLKDWLEINPRGMKDRAYLVLKKEGNPLHFTKISELIAKFLISSNKKVQVPTVHNELIRDPRFVLVGRGLYALREWGFRPGDVKDVIFQVIKETNVPLTKEEILKKVLEQRFVKPNTISLNLQDRNLFARDSQGRYTLNSLSVKEV